jgi:hypothetical protein
MFRPDKFARAKPERKDVTSFSRGIYAVGAGGGILVGGMSDIRIERCTLAGTHGAITVEYLKRRILDGLNCQ